ncbi:hypothetical protein [Mucilaginibacter gotjawali]|uniref:Uncharacterized protein n=2 Tax=Mucilaginibacter gotjawali TaxID=1550579 RepID=A0A125T234_9SPHI|nr:hypothetical protein [Mucilaginibacter gotjawali]MBB3057903.1 hypothetical protein [Mucilaginibacter gotjawali]BAU52325.1 hypothetical protein MgSA37_00480 [Mucilaginibacter gotjawali]
MTATAIDKTRSIALITAIAFAIFIGGAFMLHFVPAQAKDKIADGLMADFLVTFPAAYYFIIVRRLKTRPRSMVLVISLCCLAGYVLLPQHQRDYILQVRKLTSVIELLFIIYCITKFNKIRAAYKSEELLFADPIYNLRTAMAAVLGDSVPVKVLASEMAMLRYGLLCWKKEKSCINNSITFSTHKESGYIAIWCIILVAVTVEMIAVHLALQKWSHVAANILTLLTLYSIIFLIADLSAILKRKVLVNGDKLILRTGLRWRATTNTGNISTIKKITFDNHATDTCYKGGAIKSNCNLLITFKQPVMVEKLYGSGKEFDSILMGIDDADGFMATIAHLNAW